VRPGTLPDGVRLDAIAPTLESITGHRREHPEVRTGTAIAQLDREKRTPLVVVIAWKGLGTPDLRAAPGAWPFLRELLRSGAGTSQATTGSLPLDPAATLTTIGTGALPSAHGITGSVLRSDGGEVAAAWSEPGTGSVIATFADDLDHDSAGAPIVGAVVADPTDRGLIGDGWYLDGVDRDTVLEAEDPGSAATEAASLVRSERLGADATTDVLGVVLRGSVRRADVATASIVRSIRAAVPEATFVIAGTGSTRGAPGEDAAAVAHAVDADLSAPVVAAPSGDGLYLDRGVLVDRSLTTQRVADAVRRAGSTPDGNLFADVYPSFAVAFSRYC
jgi:hypothetical protein